MRNESIHDRYELLEYFVGKLHSRNTPVEIYTFLLDFLQAILSDRKESVSGCVFVVNDETAEFEPLIIKGDSPVEFYESECDYQVDTGIVPWCITNKRMAFTEAKSLACGKFCVIIPLFTVTRTLGLAFLHTGKSESDISRATFKILSLACLQASLYADIVEMYARLQKTQAHLVQSEKLAGIGQLAAGIAHEINNPVGFVTNNSSTLAGYVKKMKSVLELYRKQQASPEIRSRERELKIDMVLDDIDELMKENIDGLNKITEIVRAIRNFAGNVEQKVHTLADINEGLKSACVMARNEIKYHADIETDFGNIPPVECAIGELNQVFLNLLVNAAQSIREQEGVARGKIRISTRLKNNFVYIEITDNGPGIGDMILPKIFDPFFTTKPAGSGTGLGLSISYDIIVNKHNGEIDIKTAPGEGTTFILKLAVSSR
ncbi:MAG: hypothetical protein GF401_19045 [Chitinivibrionales bacterium]|nr:hypothetical protein [Chitinivibrionales bacterium]